MFSPLSSPLKIPHVVVVEVGQEAKDEGQGRLEWAVVGKGGGGDDEEVEEETKRGEAEEDTSDVLADEEKVV